MILIDYLTLKYDIVVDPESESKLTNNIRMKKLIEQLIMM